MVLSKRQKREQKVRRERRARADEERRRRAVDAEKVRRANIKILEAVGVAVARAMTEYKIGDLAARALLANVLMDHLFVDAPAAQRPVAPGTNSVQPHNHADVLDVSVGFDKAAWGG